MEVEPEITDWTASVPDDVFKNLSSHEKKRQEIINGKKNPVIFLKRL